MAHRITQVATHPKPHLDEITGLWLLRTQGQKKYPGVDTAAMVYWGTGGSTPDGRSAAAWENEGVLALGVGGGKFDEHDPDRKEGECVASLVAKDLGVDKDSGLKQILEYVTRVDLSATDSPFALASLIKAMHEAQDQDPQFVIDWACFALEAMYRKQAQFNAAAEDFAKGRIEMISGPKGKEVKLVVMQTDNPAAARYARSQHASIIIQQTSRGTVQISTYMRSGISLEDTARIVRVEEQRRSGRLITVDHKTLGSEGAAVPGAERWFYHSKGEMLLNGSLSHPKVAPTQIPLDELVKLVKIGIDTTYFDPKFASGCHQDTCGASKATPCPLYAYGLHRCRTIRHHERVRQAVGVKA